MTDHEGDNFDETPVDLGLRKSSSLEARSIADLSFAVAALATDIGEVARHLDSLTGVERDALLVGLARKLGEAGDALHDGRRVITEMTETKEQGT